MRVADIPLEPPLVKGPTTVPAVEDRSYLGYIAVALVSALAGGFLLAVWMPLTATGVIGPADRVPWMIQAHGWIQLQGWAGMFVAGMAIRLIPRFAGRRPVPRVVTVPLLAVLALPLVFRVCLQSWMDGDAADVLMLAIGASSAVGQLGVAGVLAVTLAKGRKPTEPWRYFAWAGAAWWAVWSMLSIWFMAVTIEPGLLHFEDNDRLLWVVMLGPIGNFIWGVQSRSVPIFFGRKTPRVRSVVVPGLALNLGALTILSAYDPEWGFKTAGIGFLLVGLSLVWLPLVCGAVWGEARRLRPRAKPAARFILVANGSAVVAGALLIYAGIEVYRGEPYAGWGALDTRDAARHLLGIGLVTMLILGMARLVAPVFALERTEAGVPRLLERAPFWLLVAALGLRVGSALLTEPLGYESRMHSAATAGMLAWTAIAIFAFSVLRAARAEPRTKRALEQVAIEAKARRA